MKLLRGRDVAAKLGYRSLTSIYAAVNDGTLPRPVRIGPRATAWPEHEVDQVIGARIAGLPDAQIAELVAKLHQGRESMVVAP